MKNMQKFPTQCTSSTCLIFSKKLRHFETGPVFVLAINDFHIFTLCNKPLNEKGQIIY